MKTGARVVNYVLFSAAKVSNWRKGSAKWVCNHSEKWINVPVVPSVPGLSDCVIKVYK